MKALLTEWLDFSADVQPSCLAGTDLLSSLRARTEAAIGAGNPLVDALKKIIEMNRQNALDQYGDADRAEGWSCVRVARQAILSFE